MYTATFPKKDSPQRVVANKIQKIHNTRTAKDITKKLCMHNLKIDSGESKFKIYIHTFYTYVKCLTDY